MSDGENKPRRRKAVRKHTDLEVYRRACAAAMSVFRLGKSFPVEERYSLTDRIRRSSRSVATNLAEAWRKRRYPAAFVAKLSDSEGEAAETRSWLQFAVGCGCLVASTARPLYTDYDEVIAMLVPMITHPHD